MPLSSDILVKIILLGDESVGKTTLAYRYINHSVPPVSTPTSGFSMLTLRHTIGSHDFKVQFLDTSGNSRFKQAVLPHIRIANAAVVVYDTTCQSSFDGAVGYIKAWQTHGVTRGLPCFLVANCSDSGHRVITRDVGLSLAAKQHLDYMETSATTGLNVDEMFNSVISKTFQDMGARLETSRSSNLQAKVILEQQVSGRGKSVGENLADTTTSIASNTLSIDGIVTHNLSGLMNAIFAPTTSSDPTAIIDTPVNGGGFFDGVFDFLDDSDTDETGIAPTSEWMLPPPQQDADLIPREFYRSANGRLRRFKSIDQGSNGRTRKSSELLSTTRD